MLPGLFCLYLVIASLAVAVRPDLALLAAVPAALYGGQEFICLGLASAIR